MFEAALMPIKCLRRYSFPALTDICRGTLYRPLDVLRALAHFKKTGALAKDYLISTAARPFAFIEGQGTPEALIYRAGGIDLQNIKLLLNLYPTLKNVYMIDLGYTGAESKKIWLPAVSSLDIPFNEGLNIRYYNFTHLRQSLTLQFRVIEPLFEDPSRLGRFQAVLANDGKTFKLHLIRADARLSREEMGIAPAPTVDFLNLPGYFGVLPRNPDFIRALGNDLNSGELAVILRSELSVPALVENELEVLGVDILSLLLYQKGWNRQPEYLDVSDPSSWCVLRKR